MRPMLDVENEKCFPNRTNYKGLADWIDQWMKEVHKSTNVWPKIYINSADLRDMPDKLKEAFNALATKYELWIAPNHCLQLGTCDPGAPVNVPPWDVDLVQYSWNGRLGGINSKVDLDVFQSVLPSFQSEIVVGP